MRRNKIFGLLCLGIFFISSGYAQKADLDKKLAEGRTAFENKKYVDAITSFKAALQIDSSSENANYGLANTYFTIGNFEEVIKYSDKVISARKKYTADAYCLKGSALDQQGMHDAAQNVYNEGLRSYPNFSQLHHNLAMALLKLKKYPEAASAAAKAVELNPPYPDSHLVLGFCSYFQNKRVEALLAFYNFLLLDPVSTSVSGVWKCIDTLSHESLRKHMAANKKAIVREKKNATEFATADSLLSAMEAAAKVDKDTTKNEIERFRDNTVVFIKALSETKRPQEDVWTKIYIPFYSEILKANHIDAFCYFINMAKRPELAKVWLRANRQKVLEFSKWYKNYYSNK